MYRLLNLTLLGKLNNFEKEKNIGRHVGMLGRGISATCADISQAY